MAEVIFIVLSVLLMLGILALFTRKAGLQLQYLRVQQGKPAGKIMDFLNFNWSDAGQRQLRWEAFLLFPMLYAVILDDEDSRLLQIKREVKRTHILIYIALALLIVMGVFSEKVFPKA